MNNSQGWRAVLIFVVLFLAPGSLFSLSPSEDIRTNSYYFDFLTFKSFSENKTFLEIFCQIPTENLHFVNTDDGILAKYQLAIDLLDGDSKCVDSLSFSDSVKVSYDDGVSYIPASHLVRFAFYVLPGDYLARIKLADQHTNWYVSFNRDLTIPDYQELGLLISDIQIAASITDSDEESVLVKNHKKIIPNPPHLFGMESKKLYAYSEVYNLSRHRDNVANAFLATYSILDRYGREVKRMKYQFDKPGETGAFGVGIPVEDLDSGQYRLVMEVQDLDNFQVQHKVAYFHIVKFLSAFSEEEYAKMLRQLRYLASDYEIEYLKSLPKEERLEGLQKFWKARDPIPETERNELMNEYFRRLYYANFHFDDVTTDGWETDQGRVYIENGPPDRIDRLTSSTNSKLYEIWNYSNLNLKFIFVDNWGMGTFQLLKTVNSREQGFTLH
ncbi:MAG: GWxTD domain-containing protein [bacterium]